VLALLAERPMHGYELIQTIEERSGGIWRPSPGSIYPTLQLLADEGLVTSDEGGGRKLFTLTDAGRAEAAKHGDGSPFDQERDESFEVAHRFRAELGQLGMAVWQVAQVGTEAQRTQILGVLAEARRTAYQLLADGGSDRGSDGSGGSGGSGFDGEAGSDGGGTGAASGPPAAPEPPAPPARPAPPAPAAPPAAAQPPAADTPPAE
jgi:DNA-binding PadR family transcriptional regulator